MKKHDRVWIARTALGVAVDMALWLLLVFANLGALTALTTAPGFWSQPLAGYLAALLFATTMLSVWAGMKLGVGHKFAKGLFDFLGLGEGWPS